MAEKRKDNKRRLLFAGESQLKDGRYVYKYRDLNGKYRYVYSWRLVSTDPMPYGKKEDVPLRDQEKAIQRDLDDRIIPYGANLTVYELAKKYISTKTGVRYNTEVNYRFILNVLQNDPFGNVRIDKIKQSDAKSWLIYLQASGKGYSTIHAIRGVVRPAFQMAVADDILRKNPFDFPLGNTLVNDSVTRDALTRKQKRALLEFVQNDKRYRQYYDGILILFETGMRISEFCGLTISDLDFANRTIRIDHQLQRRSDMTYIIEQPKTGSGSRVIPMTAPVYDALKRILANRNKPKIEPMVDGKAGFLFLDKNDMPKVALHLEKVFNRIVKKYNGIYKVQMPNVTPHIARHTYCSIMANSGMNPQTLCALVGHSDIATTLKFYVHVNLEDVQNEMKKVQVL